MNLSEICIKKPVFTIVISLVLVLIGLISLNQLSLRADPKIFRPRLSVDITMPGSSAEYLEKNITTPLESALRSVSNVSMMASYTRQNSTEIDLHFKNISEQTFITTQSQVNQAISAARLPQTATVRIFSGGRNGSQLMYVGVRAQNMSAIDLSDYVANTLKNDLQQVPGVGQVDAYAPQNALRIQLQPKKMAILGVTTTDIMNALKANDVALQAGEVVNKQQLLPINIISKPGSVSEFNDIIIKRVEHRIVYLKDVADVGIGSAAFAGSYTFFDGKPGAMLVITSSDDANPIKTGELLRQKIHALQQSLPPGMTMHVVVDISIPLKHSVLELYITITEAVLFVALVTLLFLGRFSFTLIPIVTIPVCILSSFGFIWLLGFSINLMTLLALVLAVGLVVDDAIVVLENCYRHVEEGLSTFNAAMVSMREVTFPVIGMTVSIIAVYLPTAFMRGKTAVYFQQFSFTLAGAVFISGIVALTLTPMMCARLSIKTGGHGYAGLVDRFFDRFKQSYSRLLSLVLRVRFIAAILFVALLIVGGYYYQQLPSSLLPKEYVGKIFAILQTPSSASSDYTKQALLPVIKKLVALPEVENVMSFGGGGHGSGNTAFNLVSLKPAYNNTKAILATTQKIQTQFQHMVEAKVMVVPLDINHGDGSQGNPSAVSFYLQGYVSYPALSEAAAKMTIALQATGLFTSVDNGLVYSSQQYNITLNRDIANQLSVPVDTINDTLQSFLGGNTISDGFEFGGILYPVIVQLPASKLSDLSVLDHIYVANTFGENVALSRLVTVTPSIGLPSRDHLNGARAAEIDVIPKEQFGTGQVIKKLEQVAKQVLPNGVSLGFSQHFLDMMHGNNTMLMIFGLGIAFIYLILSALFESFIDPFIILLTVPLCIVGAIMAIYFIGGSLNIYTSIGFVTLIGLVSKHGVLITHFANHRRMQGDSIRDAVIAAAAVRLRPILMTTATMVMGALPLVLSSGDGANSRIQVGTVIIAGMLVGTLFSLFIVPISYTVFAGWKKQKRPLLDMDGASS